MRAELARSNTLLEQRVAERTADLSSTNERLQREIIERQRAEQRLNLLVGELSHRVKNLITVIRGDRSPHRGSGANAGGLARSAGQPADGTRHGA